MNRFIVAFLFVLVLFAPAAFAQAPTAADIQALKAQIDALKADYDRRIQALETQLQTLQGQPTAAGAPPTAAAPTAPAQTQTAETPAGAAGAGGPAGQLPVYGGVEPGADVFDPEIAEICGFLGPAGAIQGKSDPVLENHASGGAFQAIVLHPV